MWIELPGDTIHTNDTLVTNVTGALFRPVHKVTIEDQTQCSTPNGYYSSRGIVWKDSFARSVFANGAEIISVHGQTDPMTDPVYFAGVQSNPQLSLAWPQIQVDRKVATDNIYIFSQYTLHSSDFAIADISLDRQYDTASRVLNLSASAHFAVSISPSSPQYRLAYVLTEDSVHSTDTAYAQNNGGYANNSNGPLAGAGIDFAAQGQYVSPSLMYYMHVARHIGGAYWGTTNSIGTSVNEGSTQLYTFAPYTIPAGYNADRMRVIVLLINISDSLIANANGVSLIARATGIEQALDKANAVKVFPNPFTDQTNIVFTLNRSENVSVRVCNLLGETVSAIDNETLPAGEQQLIINAAGLPGGVYLVTLKIGENTITKRIVLNR